MESNDRMVLMNRIQICDFVLGELNLYLDTHPTCQEGLASYQKHMAMRKEAASQYVMKYGPITAADYDGGPRWKWVDDPWPWENVKEA